MAFTQYLNIDGTDMPLPVSYDLALSDVENPGKRKPVRLSATSLRSGVAQISVSFQGITGVAQKIPRCVGSNARSQLFNTETMVRRPEKCTSTVSKLPLHTTPAEKGSGRSTLN